MGREKRENRKVRIKTIRFDFDDDFRFVYYVLDSPSFFKRFFSKKGLLKKAYKLTPGMAYFFNPNEYKEVKNEVKTYGDAKKWNRKQTDIDRNNRVYRTDEWNDYGD